MTRTLVVIGHGMVGHRLAEILRDTTWRIVVFGEEARPAYDRVALSSYVDTWNSADLELGPLPGCELRLGEKAVSVDRARRVVAGASGVEVTYDALVLATGSGRARQMNAGAARATVGPRTPCGRRRSPRWCRRRTPYRSDRPGRIRATRTSTAD